VFVLYHKFIIYVECFFGWYILLVGLSAAKHRETKTALAMP
jgi:hypothetical protein